MKQRIFSGWSFIRVLYLLSGIMIIIQSVADRQWLLALMGFYFAVTGLFAVGCAGGNCYYQPETKKKSEITEVEFEEVK